MQRVEGSGRPRMAGPPGEWSRTGRSAARRSVLSRSARPIPMSCTWEWVRRSFGVTSCRETGSTSLPTEARRGPILASRRRRTSRGFGSIPRTAAPPGWQHSGSTRCPTRREGSTRPPMVGRAGRRCCIVMSAPGRWIFPCILRTRTSSSRPSGRRGGSRGGCHPEARGVGSSGAWMGERPGRRSPEIRVCPRRVS